MPSAPTLQEAILTQNTLPVAEIDAQSGEVLRTNPAFAALVDHHPEQMPGMPVDSLVAKADRSAFRAYRLDPGSSCDLVVRFLTSSDIRREARVSLHPHQTRRSATAGPSRILVAEPILAAHPLAPPTPIRLDDAAAPVDHANIFRHIVLSANEGIWTVDADNRTTFVNERMAEMLGYKPDEIRGRPISDFLLPEDLADHANQIGRRKQGLSDRYERRFVRKDNSIVWTLVAGAPLTSQKGAYQGSFGLFSDITERKRAEEALRLSEERYRSLLAAATDYVFTVPYHHGHPEPTIHGSGCVRITGYEPHEYDADPYLWYRMIVADDRGLVESHIRQAVDGRAASAIQHRIIHRDGSVRWVRNTLVPRRDVSGNLLALDGLVTDVTERTIALQRLQERETLYRAVIETSADGFCIVDTAGRLLETNDSYVRRSGYSRAELLTMRISDIDAANSPERIAAHLDEIRRVGCDLFETRHRTKDGTLWQAEVNVSYWPIGDGRFFVFIRDVRRRWRSEALLRNRAHMAELAHGGELDPLVRYAIDAAEIASESAIGFLHFVDPEQGTLTRQTWSTNTLANHCSTEGGGRHNGIANTAIWGDCIRDRQPKIHNDFVATARRGMPEGHAPVTRLLTVPIIRGDRVVAIIGVGNKPTEYTEDDIGSVQEIADVAMDFAQRIRAENTLRRNEHQLRLIIDSVPALIAYVDPTYHIRLANEAFHQWFGDPVPTIAARTVSAQFGDSAFASVKPALDRAFAGETTGIDTEIALRGAGPKFVQGSCTPDRDESGTVRGVIVFLNDLSSTKEMEAQLLRSQRLEVVGRLASGVAHDLNNILQPVLMAPRLLRPAINDPEALGLVDTIEGSVRRGADIIRQLLAFGRGTSVRKTPIRLDSLVVELTRILRETLPKSITLRCELPAHPHPVLADSTQIHQVLMNLCLNARDAMPTGGTLMVRLEQTECSQAPLNAIPAGRSGCFQVLSVIDTGSGIAADHLPKLFDPFFTTKEIGEGTGLGLPTVLGIVRSHDGFIIVNSTPGAGSTFRVFLPTIDHPAAPPATLTPQAAVQIPPGRHHILVVDDEEDVRDLIRRTLLRSGFRVCEAANGAEAFVLLAQRENAIDLVIADLLMPVMDGAGLVHELHRRRPNLPIVAMSGHVGHDRMREQFRNSVRGFLPKPFDSDQLLNTIAGLLQQLP